MCTCTPFSVSYIHHSAFCHSSILHALTPHLSYHSIVYIIFNVPLFPCYSCTCTCAGGSEAGSPVKVGVAGMAPRPHPPASVETVAKLQAKCKHVQAELEKVREGGRDRETEGGAGERER